MKNAFDIQSFAIEINADHVPFDINFMIIPSVFIEDYPFLQRYFHELIHFWQTLGSGYLMNLMLGEWGKLKDFENKGIADNTIELMERFTQTDPKYGFSIHDLTESLCRYWEIHILDPEQLNSIKKGVTLTYDREEYYNYGLEMINKLSIDHPFRKYSPIIIAKIFKGISRSGYSGKSFYELMVEHLKEGDSYFWPFMLVNKAFGNTLSTVLFPLIGYFALQTKYPIRFFIEIIGRLSEKYKSVNKEKILINEFWKNNFHEIYVECNKLFFSLYNGALTPGWDVIISSGLNDHPICVFYRKLFNYYMQERWLYGVKYQIDLNQFFALPGQPEMRQFLAFSFRPPATIFNNGLWTVESVGDINKIVDHEDIYEKFFELKDTFSNKGNCFNGEMINNKEDLAKSATLVLERAKVFREACALFNQGCK